jgi:hypothetical protein
MEQTQREREWGPEQAEELRMARAHRRLVEHELRERRFDLFQRKAWFWILAVTTVGFGVLTVVLAFASEEPLRIGAAALTSVVAGAGTGFAAARRRPPDP